MRELTHTEAIDLVGRYEAEQAIPEQMRGDVRMLGTLLGRVLRDQAARGTVEVRRIHREVAWGVRGARGRSGRLR